MGVIGSCSEGLSTKVLPQTIAIGNIQSGIIAGKLNGEIPTQHTDGLAQGVGVDAAGDVFGELAELQRADRAGVLHHLETAEDVALRVGERLALFGVESVWAMRLMFSRTSACSFSMMRARAAIGVFFQVLNAALAEATAASISASVANGTCASTCCVAGLTTSCHSVDLRLDELAVEQHFDGRRLIGHKRWCAGH